MRHFLLAVAFAILMTGCIVPIPHKRVHEFGMSGKVVQASTLKPIADATVIAKDKSETVFKTDSHGDFKIPPVTGWHGAYFFGPIGLSLFPAMDMPSMRRTVLISAPNHVDEEYTFRAETTANRILGPVIIPLPKRNK